MRTNKLFTTQKLKATAMTYPKIVVMSVILLTSLAGFAQQVNEKEVQLQEKFIDASREHILGNYEKAASIYEEILKSDPTNHAVAYELARIYDTRDDAEKSLRFIKIAIANDATNDWYRRFLADVYQKQGKNVEAAQLYEELVKKEPDNEYFYQRWAYFLVKANDISKALKVYDELEKRIGISEELVRRKHALYVGMGNNKKAAEELEKLVQNYPTTTEYYHLLAGFYEQIGEATLAAQIYRRVLKVAPEDARATMALAGTQTAKSGDAQYLESLRAIFEKPDVNIDLKISKIMPMISKVADTGDKTLAAATLQLTQILETVHPDDAKGFAASGDLLYYAGDKTKALEKYQKALKLEDTVFLVWEQVLRIQLESKDYNGLRKTSEEALDLFPNKAFVYYMNGVALNELDRHEDALDALEQAKRTVGNNGKLLFDIHIRRGLVYNILKQNDKSNAAFEDALKLNPKAPEALSSYAYTLALRGETLDKAKSMAKQATDLAPNNPQYLATYGWVMYKAKDYKSAKEWLGKALANNGSDDSIILEHYGDVLFQMNDVENAWQYWTKAQEKGGVSEFLEKKIADRRLYE